MTVDPQSAPVAALSDNELLNYADPFYDMAIGDIDFSEFWPMVGAYAVLAVLIVAFPPDFSIASVFIAGCFVAHRLSRLKGHAPAVTAAREKVAADYFLHVIGLEAAKLIARAFASNGSSVGDYIYAAFGLYFLGRFIFYMRREKLWQAAKAVHEKRPKLSVLDLDALEEARSRIARNRDRLLNFAYFNSQTTVINEAWAKRKNAQLEQLFKQGDAQTRRSWQLGIGVYNHASQVADAGRRHLQTERDRAVAVIRELGIDPAALISEKSKSLEGDAPIEHVQRDIMQRLNYSQGLANIGAKTVTGQVPWQFAAVALVATAIIHLANESKMQRQLKDLEGVLTANAEAARGDRQLIDTLLSTRLLPQIDETIRWSHDLHNEVHGLRAAQASGASTQHLRDRAHNLALAIAASDQVIKQAAGD